MLIEIAERFKSRHFNDSKEGAHHAKPPTMCFNYIFHAKSILQKIVMYIYGTSCSKYSSIIYILGTVRVIGTAFPSLLVQTPALFDMVISWKVII